MSDHDHRSNQQVLYIVAFSLFIIGLHMLRGPRTAVRGNQVAALGITWILDGLEVTLAGALSGALKESPTLQFSNFDVGLANSAYLETKIARLGHEAPRRAPRPPVTIHYAQTLDGRLATRTGDSQWISAEPSTRFAHGLRASHAAVMVGAAWASGRRCSSMDRGGPKRRSA